MFNRFFNEIKGLLKKDKIGFQFNGVPQFGSDQEKAIISALEDNFPECILVFCELHLKKNLLRHLQKMRLPSKVKSTIYQGVFGPKGLIQSSCPDDYEANRLQFENKFGRFMEERYMNEFLNRIYYNVCNPNWSSDRIDMYYTNNDNECYNSMVKRRSKRRALTIPQTSILFSSLIEYQEKLVACAVQGFNKFSLQQWMEKDFAISSDRWDTMSAEKKKDHLSNVYKGPKPPMEYFVSKGGEFRILKHARINKKPGENRRPAASFVRPRKSAVRTAHQRTLAKERAQIQIEDEADDVFPLANSPQIPTVVPSSSNMDLGSPLQTSSQMDNQVVTPKPSNNRALNNPVSPEPLLDISGMSNISSSSRHTPKYLRDKQARLEHAKKYLSRKYGKENSSQDSIQPKSKKLLRFGLHGRQLATPSRYKNPLTPSPPEGKICVVIVVVRIVCTFAVLYIVVCF